MRMRWRWWPMGFWWPWAATQSIGQGARPIHLDGLVCTCRVMVQGPGPSARYAHTLALVANRFLVAMGGNDGKQTLSDAWALDTSDKPYQWSKITDAGETPSPR